MKGLPTFKPRHLDRVQRFVAQMLTNEYQIPPEMHLREVIAYPDGYYRALFSPAYFILTEGQTEPSKSQWNTLKKKFKRHDPLIFIFKDYGESPCGEVGETCVYLDFGFLPKSD